MKRLVIDICRMLIVAIVLMATAQHARSQFAVFNNRLMFPVEIRAAANDSGLVAVAFVAPGQSFLARVPDSLVIDWKAETHEGRDAIRSSRIYAWTLDEQRVVLREVELPKQGEPPLAAGAPAVAIPHGWQRVGAVRIQRPNIIPIRAFVDEEQPATQRVWERQLLRAVETVNHMLEFTGVQFAVREHGDWRSSRSRQSVDLLREEFETQIEATDDALTLGMSFQPVTDEPASSCVIASYHAPWSSHLLVSMHQKHSAEIDAWRLTHALAHWLGATHSPEPATIMGRFDKLPSRVGVLPAFDPINTLVLGIAGRELQSDRGGDGPRLDRESAELIGRAYRLLSETLPDDAHVRRHMPQELEEKPVPNQPVAKLPDPDDRPVKPENLGNQAMPFIPRQPAQVDAPAPASLAAAPHSDKSVALVVADDVAPRMVMPSTANRYTPPRLSPWLLAIPGWLAFTAVLLVVRRKTTPSAFRAYLNEIAHDGSQRAQWFAVLTAVITIVRWSPGAIGQWDAASAWRQAVTAWSMAGKSGFWVGMLESAAVLLPWYTCWSILGLLVWRGEGWRAAALVMSGTAAMLAAHIRNLGSVGGEWSWIDLLIFLLSMLAAWLLPQSTATAPCIAGRCEGNSGASASS